MVADEEVEDVEVADEMDTEAIVEEGTEGGKMRIPGASIWIWPLMMWQFLTQVGGSIFYYHH